LFFVVFDRFFHCRLQGVGFHIAKGEDLKAASFRVLSTSYPLSAKRFISCYE
jgi:hypothetical protein